MHHVYLRPSGVSSPAAATDIPAFRRPTRVTATLPWKLHRDLQTRADYEGRSLSNLIASLLEKANAT